MIKFEVLDAKYHVLGSVQLDTNNAWMPHGEVFVKYLRTVSVPIIRKGLPSYVRITQLKTGKAWGGGLKSSSVRPLSPGDVIAFPSGNINMVEWVAV